MLGAEFLHSPSFSTKQTASNVTVGIGGGLLSLLVEFAFI